MTTFKYKGLSPDGQKVSGVVKAYNEYEAVTQLRSTCSVITSIQEVKEAKGLNRNLGKVKIKDKDLAMICSQFSIILTSGLPIVRCVEMVAEQAADKQLRDILYQVAEDVSGGYSLATSFENPARPCRSPLSRPSGPVRSPAPWSCASAGSIPILTNPPRPRQRLPAP